MTLTDTQVGEYVNVVDSYTNKTGARQVIARTANTITVSDWDGKITFARKDDSFWAGDYYLEARAA
jgi:hypothetical protein